MEPVPRPDVSPAEQQRTIGALQADARHTTVTLNFREARFVHPIVTIDLITAHSTLLLIVPPEVGVDVESVRPNHTKLPDSIGPSDSGPILTLRGATEHGRVKVRRTRGG